ncbi:MAG TPA: oligosaccharide flippase family protein [Gemmatimonadaceae bacterium]|jgi:O-antigen/teichoic acid export membrane protein
MGRVLVRNTVVTAFLRLSSSAMSFGIGILAARVAGVAQYGAYAYAMSILTVATVVATLGLDRLVVREVATRREPGDDRDLRGLLRWSHMLGVVASLGTVILAALFWPALTASLDIPTRQALAAGALLLPLAVWLRVQQSALQGLNRMVAGQLPETLIQPATLGILLVIIAAARRPVDGRALVVLQTAGAAAACGVAGWMVWGSFHDGAKGQRVFRHRAWGLALVPLLLTSGLSVATNQADMLILGAMNGATAAGIYSAAIRSAALIGFVLASANLAMAPTFASLHSSGDIAALQRLVTKSARYILLLATPVAVAMIVGGQLLLAAFGVDFIAGITPLRILSVGQWVNAGMGSVAFLLMMTGHARDVTIGLAAGLALNVALSLLLVPHFGTTGAATAATASVIFWNGVLAWCVHKRLGVDGTAAGIFTKRRSG